MAKFILDGQEYGGGSGSRIVKLTQAEYDALPNDKLSDDIIYLIKDSGELTAENLFYDGSETGLGNTVQDAVDNLDEKVSEQNKKFGVELLWSNPKPTSEFSAQTVNIDTSKYLRFLVLASYYTASEYTVNELLNVKGITQTITTNATALNKRTATVNDNGIAFGKGVFLTNNSWADSNGNTVPKFIYGVY